MPYVYKRTEPQLWTVGFYTPNGGHWEPESDHDSPEKAADRVRYLNGGNIEEAEASRQRDELLAASKSLLFIADSHRGGKACTCHAMKDGFACPYCEARAAIARAGGGGEDESGEE